LIAARPLRGRKRVLRFCTRGLYFINVDRRGGKNFLGERGEENREPPSEIGRKKGEEGRGL